MSATTFVLFYRTTTGLLIDDITWDFCKKVSDGTPVITDNCTLAELGVGRYLLTNPDVTEDTVYSLHVTADPLQYSDGLFVIADYATQSQAETIGINSDVLLAFTQLMSNSIMAESLDGSRANSVTSNRVLVASEYINLVTLNSNNQISQLGTLTEGSVWTQDPSWDALAFNGILLIDSELTLDTIITFTVYKNVESTPRVITFTCPKGLNYSYSIGLDGHIRGISNFNISIPAKEATQLAVQSTVNSTQIVADNTDTNVSLILDRVSNLNIASRIQDTLPTSIDRASPDQVDNWILVRVYLTDEQGAAFDSKDHDGGNYSVNAHYRLYDRVIPTNGNAGKFCFQMTTYLEIDSGCISPVWPQTIGDIVADDNNNTWTNIGWGVYDPAIDYSINDIVRPIVNNAGSFFYKLTTNGAGAAIEPAWDQIIGSTTTDASGNVWTNINQGLTTDNASGFGIMAFDDQGAMWTCYADNIGTPLQTINECVHHNISVLPQKLVRGLATGDYSFWMNIDSAEAVSSRSFFFAYFDKARWEPGYSSATDHHREMRVMNVTAMPDIESVKLVTNKLDTMLETPDIGVTYKFTQPAVSNSPVTDVTDIETVTNKLNTMLEAINANYRFTLESLGNAPNPDLSTVSDVTDKLDTMLEADGQNFRLTLASLANAPDTNLTPITNDLALLKTNILSNLVGGVEWTQLAGATFTSDYGATTLASEIDIYASSIRISGINEIEKYADILLGTIDTNGNYASAGTIAATTFDAISLHIKGQSIPGTLRLQVVGFGHMFLRLEYNTVATRLYLTRDGWTYLSRTDRVITDLPASHTLSLATTPNWQISTTSTLSTVVNDVDMIEVNDKLNAIREWNRKNMVAAGQIKWSSMTGTISTTLPAGMRYEIYYYVTDNDERYEFGYFDETGWHQGTKPEELLSPDDFTFEGTNLYLQNSTDPLPTEDIIIPACTITLTFNRWGITETYTLPVPARVWGPNGGTQWCLFWDAVTKIPVMWGAGPIWTGNMEDDDFQTEVIDTLGNMETILDQFSATTDLFSLYVEDQNNDPVSTMHMEIWLGENRVKSGATGIDGVWATGGLPSGDYVVRGFLPGYEFEDQTITLPANSITVSAIKNTIPVAPPTPSSVTLYGYVIDTDGQAIQNALIDVTLVGTDSVFVDGSAVGNRTTALTNRFGYFEMTLIKEVPLIIKCENVRFYKKHTFAAGDTVVDWADIP